MCSASKWCEEVSHPGFAPKLFTDPAEVKTTLVHLMHFWSLFALCVLLWCASYRHIQYIQLQKTFCGLHFFLAQVWLQYGRASLPGSHIVHCTQDNSCIYLCTVLGVFTQFTYSMHLVMHWVELADILSCILVCIFCTLNWRSHSGDLALVHTRDKIHANALWSGVLSGSGAHERLHVCTGVKRRRRRH